jgi:hypothetical protein
MPYQIVKRGNQWCIFNNDTKARVACHNTKSGAQRQLRALYANVPDAGEPTSADEVAASARSR